MNTLVGSRDKWTSYKYAKLWHTLFSWGGDVGYLFLFSLLFITLTGYSEAFSSPLEKGSSDPAFVFVLGESARPKDMDEAKSCRLYWQEIMPSKKRQELESLVAHAFTQKDIKAFHILAQVPSVHIWAFHKGSKFLLFYDYEYMTRKQGKEAENLIQYVRNQCRTKLGLKSRSEPQGPEKPNAAKSEATKGLKP